MNPSDGRQFLEDLHEDAIEWFENDLSIAGKSWGSISSFKQFEKIAKYVIMRTPLRFAECFFTNAEEDGGGRWRFYDYQKDMAEYLFNLVQRGAYGTGKTRDLEAKIMWSMVVEKGSCLLATLSETSRSTVFDELDYIRSRSAFLSSIFPDSSFKRGNVPRIFGPYGNECRFILVGREGRMAHSIHAGRVFGDECAQWPESSWHAVMSRAKEGASIQLHSVPNGPPGNTFEQLADAAIPLERMRIDPNIGVTDEHKTLFAYAHFERPQMPGWNENEKRRAIELYGKGSEASPNYQAWVLGRKTDAVNVVWRQSELDSIFVRVPGYRLLQISWNEPDNSVTAVSSIGLDLSDGRSMRRLSEKKYPIHSFDIVECVNQNISGVICDSIGYDHGELVDPSEIGIIQQIDGGCRVRARIELMYVPFDEQLRLLLAIENRQCQFWPIKGWGIEGSDTKAKAIYKSMVGKTGGVDKDRITMYDWLKNRPLVPKLVDGEIKHKFDKKKDQKFWSEKEYCNDLIDNGIKFKKEFGRDGIELHKGDSVMRREFDEHTYKIGRNNRIQYNEKNDHCIEMVRVGNARLYDARISRSTTRVKSRNVGRIRGIND